MDCGPSNSAGPRPREDWADVAQSWRATLQSEQSVTVDTLPDGGLRITAVPGRDRPWVYPLVAVLMGIVCAALGIALLSVGNPFPMIPQAPPILIIGGFLNVFIGLGVGLIRAVNGPPRPSVLEARSGLLNAVRFIAGDRVNTRYPAGEVSCLFIEDNSLWVETRNGPSPLVQFGKREVNQAIGMAIAMELWRKADLLIGPSKRGNRVVIFPAPAVEAAGTSQDDTPTQA